MRELAAEFELKGCAWAVRGVCPGRVDGGSRLLIVLRCPARVRALAAEIKLKGRARAAHAHRAVCSGGAGSGSRLLLLRVGGGGGARVASIGLSSLAR